MAPWSAPRLAGTGVGPRCGACSSSSSGSSPSSRRRRTRMNTIAPMPSSTSSAPATIRIVENPLPPPLPDALVVPGWGRALSGTGWLGSATAGAETVGVAVASSDNVWKLYDCPACTLAFLVTALYPSLTASIARVPGAIGLAWVLLNVNRPKLSVVVLKLWPAESCRPTVAPGMGWPVPMSLTVPLTWYSLSGMLMVTDVLAGDESLLVTLTVVV